MSLPESGPQGSQGWPMGSCPQLFLTLSVCVTGIHTKVDKKKKGCLIKSWRLTQQVEWNLLICFFLGVARRHFISWTQGYMAADISLSCVCVSCATCHAWDPSCSPEEGDKVVK